MAKKNSKPSPLAGRSIAFFGQFAYWPTYHGGSPAEVAARLGATVQDAVDPSLEILVLGDKRGKGRSEARKKAEQLQKRATKSADQSAPPASLIEIIDEAAYRDLVKLDVKGKRFNFCGGFDCCPSEMDGVLEGMVAQAGGKVHTAIDDKLDYLVVGNRRGKGKTAALRAAELLRVKGCKLSVLDEAGFLELVRIEGSTRRKKMDFASFVGNLYSVADERKVQRALKMLQKETFQLYSKANQDRVVGIVRSQTGAGTFYAPWIESGGSYGCSDPELCDCMGLQGSLCKHLVVLLLGLVQAEELDASETFQWLRKASGKRPKKNGEPAAEAFLEFKGVEAGEVDWRPTETVPEDFYAF